MNAMKPLSEQLGLERKNDAHPLDGEWYEGRQDGYNQALSIANYN